MNKKLKIFAFAFFVLAITVIITSCGKKEEAEPATSETTETYNNETVPVDESAENENAVAEKGEEQVANKFDDMLVEAIDNAEKGGVNPNFAVDIVLNGEYSDAIVKSLENYGVDVISGENNKLRAVATPKVLKEIQGVYFIQKIVLVTANYYPNK
jgi:major membrane immunogen (membrane-anchored lipoprotein)